jgi:hypothetical protein
VIRALRLIAALCAAANAAPAAAEASVSDPGQGSLVLDTRESGARELSGIAAAGGDRYWAVSDKGARLFPLEIRVDPETGAIREARVGEAVRLARGVDLEGVAFDPESGRVFAVDEVGPAIRAYRTEDGAVVAEIALPPLLRSVRFDRSLESLAFDPGFGMLWTANEESLRGDGDKASAESGTLVRLQRFDRALAAAGQWAYRSDPIPGASAEGLARNGVADLLVLPGGGLLVLERSLGQRGLGARLFEVDFEGATDVSAIDALAGAGSGRPRGCSVPWKAWRSARACAVATAA